LYIGVELPDGQV